MSEMWSKTLPGLQLAWDKTSLKALQFCPTRYNFEIKQGYRKDTADLRFGSLFASAVETFRRGLLSGQSFDDAQRAAVRWALQNSGEYVTHDDHEHWVPWGGEYQDQWHCTGTEKYKNEKGNAAKCPWSKKGQWFTGSAPSVCGTCGSPTERQTRYVPYDKYKNRRSLMRLVVWYIEEQRNSGVQPHAFADGTPGVELSFKLPLPWKARLTGESFQLVGHIDGIGERPRELFTMENKTTKKSLGKMFFDGYNPSLDISIYDIATNVLFPDLPITGMLLEGAQILIDGARFDSALFRRTEAQREEAFKELEWWIRQAERYAEEDYYPRAEANCWICPFKEACRLPQKQRKLYLDQNFEKRLWDPTIER